MTKKLITRSTLMLDDKKTNSRSILMADDKNTEYLVITDATKTKK